MQTISLWEIMWIEEKIVLKHFYYCWPSKLDIKIE